MAAFTIENLTFTYPRKTKPALEDFSLQIHTGEFLVLCGQSGSGKSTLLRNLKSILAPHGTKTGRILFYGRPIETITQREQTRRIGYVLQNPDNQLVTDKVWHELAFGLESLGCDNRTIRLRVAEMASFFGIQSWFMKEVNQLSGGQKQLLNLAAVMAMQPDVLILDEPTSQLDPIAAGDFLETVRKINRELGTTVILSEHRLEDVVPMADRAVVMDRGRIIAADTPANVGAILAQMNHDMFMAMPTPLQSYAILYQEGIGTELPCPVNVREGRTWLTDLCRGKQLSVTGLAAEEEPEHKDEEPVIKIKDVWFKYNKKDDDVLKGLSLEVYKGELFCMVGGNGTGKTTTLTLASGINRPYRGKIAIRGKDIKEYKSRELFKGLLGVLPQNPQAVFVEKTVWLDLMEMLEGRGMKKAEKEKRVKEVAELVELESLLDMHPYDLSGGEQQRAALAKILLLDPQLLFLDEPTKGLDSCFKKKLADILAALRRKGVTIVMVSHDIEFCGRYADRCAMFFDGKIVATNAPRKFFAGNSFYTTAANRMSRHIFENAVTVEDVVDLCRANLNSDPEKKLPPHSSGPTASPQSPDPEELGPPGSGQVQMPANSIAEKAHTDMQQTEDREPAGRKAKAGRHLLSAGALVLSFAATLAGYFLLDDHKYYFISLLLIVFTMIPFFAGFERRKPQARELILIAVMVAIAVVGRAAFFMVPQFKPIVALVIISGLALGRESGFLVGAMAAFVSNFIFGQGPWTPWQMFAMGLIGYLAGIFAERKLLGEKKLPILIFGFLSAAVLYGLIVDLWTIFAATPDPSWATAAVIYGAAIPMNLIHGTATAFFLFFLERPMAEKLDRVKLKYGMEVFSL